ncbi:MAG: hypothetical protein E3J21_04725 [Anaerolineales bacterium]|nr:MAG: hypothetical protein E3J21_04725 [Anaerolineales bacterium]
MEMIAKKVHRITENLERKGQYNFEVYRGADQPVVVSLADVRVGDRTYPCDTAIDIDPGQQPGSEDATFTTLIHEGVSGQNAEMFDKAVEILNYNYPGKFVRDYTDRSQDVLYNTRERVSNLSPEVVSEHLEEHVKVKARVTPELEHVRAQLGLGPKESATKAEEFAIDWEKTLRHTKDLPHGPEVIYLPRWKRALGE